MGTSMFAASCLDLGAPVWGVVSWVRILSLILSALSVGVCDGTRMLFSEVPPRLSACTVVIVTYVGGCPLVVRAWCAVLTMVTGVHLFRIRVTFSIPFLGVAWSGVVPCSLAFWLVMVLRRGALELGAASALWPSIAVLSIG